MKLLASDFDNTLFNGNDFNENIRYINKFVDAGNIFVIVTGRPIGNLLKDVKISNLKYNYLICKDGGIIFDKDLNILYQKDLNQDDVGPISSLLEQSPYIEEWYIDTGIELTKDKNSKANGLIGRFNNREEAYKLLQKIKNDYKTIDGYISMRWVNISHNSVNKGSGIRQLLKLINIDEKDVFTIGDDINDLPMTHCHFNCFRMKKSVPELTDVTIRAYNSVYELIIDILKEELK